MIPVALNGQNLYIKMQAHASGIWSETLLNLWQATMRYGTCTWIFGDEPLASLAPRLAALGLDGIELFGDLLLDLHEARKILADHHLDVLSLTPDNVDPCHPDPTIRRGARDYYFRLIDFAAEVGAPLISCHGKVGRVRAADSYDTEWNLMVEAVRDIAQRARQNNLRVAIELLNRYEAHLLNHVGEGLRFVNQVGAANVGLLLDTYHMNIEEADLPGAIERGADKLFVFHAADSNRQAVGRGHIPFRAIARALQAINYGGDVIFECVAVGPDPFTPIKGPASRHQVEMFIGESLTRMREYVNAMTG
jgi:sugar phosphate isomerase/epimerase